MSYEPPRTIIVSGDYRRFPRGIKYAKTSEDPEQIAGLIATTDSSGNAKILGDPINDRVMGIFPHQLQDVSLVDDQYRTDYAKDKKPVSVIQEDTLLCYGVLGENQSISEGDILTVGNDGRLEEWDSSKPIVGIALDSATTGAGESAIIKFDFLSLRSNIIPFAIKETLSVSSNKATCTYYPLAITSVRISQGTNTGVCKVTDDTPGSLEVKWEPGSKEITFNSGDAATECVIMYLAIKA